MYTDSPHKDRAIFSLNHSCLCVMTVFSDSFSSSFNYCFLLHTHTAKGQKRILNIHANCKFVTTLCQHGRLQVNQRTILDSDWYFMKNTQNYN